MQIPLALLSATLILSSGGLRLTLNPIFELKCDLDASDPWSKVYLDNETDTKRLRDKQKPK